MQAYMQRFILSALLLCSLTISNLLAQGAISGTVYDKASGETVIGASVLEKTTGAVTITDFDGKYTFKLDPGTYTLEFSYIGYPNLLVEGVEVKKGEIAYQDVTMSDEDGVELDLDVTVKATRVTNSEVGVLMLRKEAAVVTDNIGAQEMARYGASDAGGALKKVTGTSVEGGKYIFVRGLGDRYSLAQLNGLTIPSTDPYRNSAQLDLVPTNLIDNISTAKTSSPDQPGNFTGGNVNIITKKFPELETFQISLSTGYNSQSNFIDNFQTQETPSNDYFGFDNSRGLPTALTDPASREFLSRGGALDANRGDQASAEAIDAAARSVIPQVAPDQERSFLDHGLALSYGNRIDMGKNRLGVIATASFKQDYQHLDNFKVGNWRVINTERDSMDNNGVFNQNRSTINPTLTGLLGLTYRIGDNNEIGFTGMYNHSSQTTSLTSLGERPNDLFAPRLVQGFALSHIEQELINYQASGEHVLPNLNNLKIEWRGSLVNSSQYEPQTRFFENIFNTETGQYEEDGADLNSPFYFWRELQDEQKIGKIDITLPLANKSNSIKVGGLYSIKDRVSTQDAFRLRYGTRSTPLDELGGDQNAFVADANMGIAELANGRYRFANYLIDDTEASDSYEGSEEILATYGMLTYQITDKLKFVGGARLEITNTEAVSQDTSETVGRIEETDLLPSGNFIYELTKDFNIRASYSKTIARPTLREISSFTIIDPLTNTFERGNPDSLGRSLIDNFDLRFEYFLGGNELVALSGYYKKFTDPIARVQLPVSPNNEFQYQNMDEGHLFGVEFELRKKLGFVWNKLQNFSFITNASFIFSDISTNNSDSDSELAITSRNFIGQPDYIINAALNYSLPEQGWDIALAANATGDRVATIGSFSGNRRDQIARARTQLDFIASKKFGRVGTRLSILNILDDPFRVSADYKGAEYIFQDFRRGVDVKFNVSFTF
ncbi:hypothetical protein CEQ90_05610 [Lewinellaceae bacterium SD302]|nr:hypothetical protein CEQ90_05610 [Lewinellaceae bacterium SD302]